MPAQVCFVVGARPNFMKSAPVLRALEARGIDVLLVHTGQHYDAEMSDVFLDQLGLPKPDVFLGVGSGSHAEQTARALVGVEGVLVEEQPALVVVPGDVNSTLAGALAAVKLQIPVAHLEAGLRSYDRTMPEEHNRVVADHVSSVLLAHSASAVDNLAAEGIAGGHVHLVGNTMIDSLLEHLDTARAAAPWRALGVEPRTYGLVTLHRPALVDDPALLREATAALSALAVDRPIVFPVHPRTQARLEELSIDTSGLVLTAPLGYLEFLGLEAEAAFVLTDSGGVQEETSALGVPCFTLRDTTERPITVELGTNTVLGLQPERIRAIPGLLREPRAGAGSDDGKAVVARPETGSPSATRAREIPLWDGEAGPRAADVLAAELEGAYVRN
jgi:UDP-N-acetylglucosamine 2-epimerase (non-hydrolysing)